MLHPIFQKAPKTPNLGGFLYFSGAKNAFITASFMPCGIYTFVDTAASSFSGNLAESLTKLGVKMRTLRPVKCETGAATEAVSCHGVSEKLRDSASFAVAFGLLAIVFSISGTVWCQKQLRMNASSAKAASENPHPLASHPHVAIQR